MESAVSPVVSRKKQGVFWSAVAYTILFALLLGVKILVGVGGVDPFALSQFVAVRLAAMVMLLLVIPRGHVSALVLTAGFTFLAITDCLGIFLVGDFDMTITLIPALIGLAFAVRSYVRVQEKAKAHILVWVLTLVGLFWWSWYVGMAIGTFDAIVRGSAEAKSDAIQSLLWVVLMPILWTVMGIRGSRGARKSKGGQNAKR